MESSHKNSEKYSFDEPVERKNTRAIKYEYAKRRGLPEDILPLWVADMDFRSPPCVTEALDERSRHGIFGYSDITEDYVAAVQSWYRKRYAYEVNEQSLVTVQGVVFGLYTAISAFTRPGDAVMLQRPVYYPFSSAILDLDRKLVNNPLVFQDGRYVMDFQDFERKVVENQVKLFILCNPQNPSGRVWTREELIRMGEICLRHHVLVVSDEIHSDFVFPGYTHTIFASISQAFADITITCTAPSKTFNLAGLQISNLFITNPELLKLFKQALKKSGYSQPNLMGMIACQAAYEGGEAWLTSLLSYLEANISYVRDRLKKDFPAARLMEPEGTYLLWIDFSGLGLTDADLRKRIEQKAKVWLDHGTMFGPEGEGYQRINIACPRKTLVEAMDRLKRGILS